MARDVVTRLSVRDDLTPALTKASSAADKLATSSEKAARSAAGLDKASGAARQMEGALKGAATSAGRLGSASKDIDKVSTQMERANRSAGMLKAGIAGLVGGLAVGGLDALVSGLGGAMTAASDLNETMNKSQAVFGAQADSMAKWGDAAATSLGMSKSAALEAAAGFGDMFSQLGFAGDAAANMSKQVVQMSADLGSFNNLPTADVADRISAAFRGEYDSLQLLIPNISAARVEQQAMAMTGEASAKSLTAQQKAAAVLAIVQQDGARAMGDFARTSQDAANAQKVAQAQAADLAAEIGQGLLPAWTAALKVANTTILPALSTLASGAGAAASAVADLPAPIQAVGAAFLAWKVAGPAIQGLTAASSGPVVGQFRNLATAVSMAGMASKVAGGGFTGAAAGLRAFTGQASVGGAAMSGLKAAGSGLLGVLGGPWGVAIMAAGAAIGYFAQKSQEAKARQEELRQQVQSVAQTVSAAGGVWTQAASQQLVELATQKNLIANYQQMGYSIDQVTSALTQEGPARQAIIGQIDAKIRKLEEEQAAEMAATGARSTLHEADIAYYQQQKQGLLDVAQVGSEAAAKGALSAAAMHSIGQAAGESAVPLRSMADSIGSLPPSLQGTATAAAASKVTMAEWAAGVNAAGINVKELDAALQKLMGAFDVEAATDAWNGSLRELGATLKSVNGDLDANSAAGEKVRAAMRGQVSDGIALIKTMAEQGASSSELSAKASQLAGDIEKTGAEAGMSKAEMSRYTDALRKVPAEVKTNVAISGLGQAKSQLGDFVQKLTGLDGRMFTAAVRVAASGPLALLRGYATGGRIVGPGTGTSDSILAALSNGEHVLTAREVAAMGGHAAVERLRAAALDGGLPAFRAGGQVRVAAYAAGGPTIGTGGTPTRGGYSLTDKGLTIDVTAAIQKVVPPTTAVPLTVDLSLADSAMLRGPELVSLLTGIDLPELDPVVKKVRDNYTRLIGILSSQVKDQQQLNDAVAKAQSDVTKARQDYASAVSGAASGAATSATSAAVKGKASGALASSKAKPYLPQILAMGAKYGVAPELIAAVMQAESGFNPNAGSSAGARGLMQLMPGTFRGLGVRGKITDPNANIEAGTKYLSQMLAKVGGDVEKALRAYNAGPGAIAKSYGYKETNAYVAKIGRDAGVKSLAGSGRYGSSAVAGVNPSTAGVRAKVEKTVSGGVNPLVESMISNAEKLVGRFYKWGGGHAANSHKSDLNTALVDCSGFLNTALGHTLKKNVNRVAKDWTKGKGIQSMSVKDALKTRGAFLGTDSHVVMSLGDGRIMEAPQTGKKVRIIKADPKRFSRAGWYTGLGTPGSGAVAGSVTGATGSKATDPAAAKQALADAERALKLAQQEAQLNTKRAAAVDQLKSKLVAALPQMESMAVAHAEAAANAKRYAEELAAAKKAQDDYAASVAGSITAQGELSKLWRVNAETGSITALSHVIEEREKLVKASLTFRDQVKALQSAGLNADDLRDVMDMGAEAGGRLAQQLLQERGSIADLNRTRIELRDAAGEVGKDFGDVIYGDQVRAADSIAKVWADKEKSLGEAAWKVGQSMQAEIMRGLGLTDGALGKTTSDLLEQMKAQWLASLGIAYAPSKAAAAAAQPRLSTPAMRVASAPTQRVEVQATATIPPGTQLIVQAGREFLGALTVMGEQGAERVLSGVQRETRWQG